MAKTVAKARPEEKQPSGNRNESENRNVGSQRENILLA